MIERSNDFTARCFEQERVSRIIATVEELEQYTNDAKRLADLYKRENVAHQSAYAARQAVELFANSSRSLQRRISSFDFLHEDHLANAIRDLTSAVNLVLVSMVTDVVEKQESNAPYRGGISPFYLPSNYDTLEGRVRAELAQASGNQYTEDID